MTWQDELKEILNPAQIKAVNRVRVAALQIPCRTPADSRAMTAGNMLPLFIKERGLEWAKMECETMLRCASGIHPAKRTFRRAVLALLKTL